MPDIITSTTQQFLDIHDITNNFVIMKDGTISIVLMVNAMNFGLLAEEEQDAVMYAYAGLLNSLNYPIQIIVNSTTKDVTAYLQLLQDQEEVTVNETLRRRIGIYREFVSNLIQERNVLDKKFYVSIPANAIELGLMGAATVLPGKTKLDITSVERSILLEKAQNLLEPKRDHLIAQFARIGLFSRQLSTQEIIQLFYIRYNPEAAEGQQIGESSSYTSPLVQASIQGSVMNNPIDPNQTPGMPQAPGGTPAPMGDISQPPQAPAPTEAPPVTPMPDMTMPPTPTPDMGAAMPAGSILTPAPEAPTEQEPPAPASILPDAVVAGASSTPARPSFELPAAQPPQAPTPDAQAPTEPTTSTPSMPPSPEPMPSMSIPTPPPITETPGSTVPTQPETPMTPEPTPTDVSAVQGAIDEAAKTVPGVTTPPSIESAVDSAAPNSTAGDEPPTPPVPTL